jgi:Family of unknown function (DUF6496)
VPDKETIERARKDERQGKAASTQAGEFVREEMDHIRQGKHGARSTKQAIAIGLSKARRAGVDLPVPKKETASAATRRKAKQDSEKGEKRPTGASGSSPSPRRSRATSRALKREGSSAASPLALSRQAHRAAKKRSASSRSAAARRAARTRAREK